MRVRAALAAPGVILCVGVLAAQAQRGDAAELAGKIERIRRTANFRASGRLVNVDAQGRRETFKIDMQATAGARTTAVVYNVLDPEPSRMRISIELRQAGAAGVRVAGNGEKTPKDVPFANWRQAILGSGLTFEDLVDDQFRWSRQRLGEPEKYGARLCRVLKSEPGPADRTHYSLVTSWIDEGILHPVKVEKVVRDTGAVKEFLYYGLRKSGGLWSASQIEVRTKGKAGSTFLIITRGAVDKPGAP